MSILYEYPGYPDFANPVDTDLDRIRDRIIWSLCASVCNGMVLIPGWSGVAYSTSSPQNLSQPDYWLLDCNADSRQIRLDLTWASSKITQVVIKYNDGVSSPGMATVDDGTITITYDGSNNITGYTSA